MINSREFVPRGHLRLIAGGGPDAAHPWQDTPHTAATAFVPEAFLAACHCTASTPRDVDVCGMTVTVIPSRRVTNDSGADLIAWETFHQIVLTATARGDIGHERQALPLQITAASWRTTDGRHLRVTGAYSLAGHRLWHRSTDAAG